MEISNRAISTALYQAKANGLQFLVGVLTAIDHADLAQQIISADIEVNAAVAARDEKYPVAESGDFWGGMVVAAISADTAESFRVFAAYQQLNDLLSQVDRLRESLEQ